MGYNIDAIMSIARGKAVSSIRKPFAIKDGQVIQWYEPCSPALFLFFVCDNRQNYMASEKEATGIAKRYWGNVLPSIHCVDTIDEANVLYNAISDYSKGHVSGHV